uniref:Protein kinase domain-containing protein n=1 Tax=Haemonchus contortus TaxID=6289 RepID=A0A7I4YUS3_HAECO
MHNVQDDDAIQPYVNLQRMPFHQHATASTDSEYDARKAVARRGSGIPSIERESDTENTDCEVTFRDQENNEGDREHEPSQVFEILYDYEARNNDELNLTAGTTVKLIRRTEEELWFYGEREDGTRGLFPGNYVKLLGSDAKIIAAEEISDPPTGRDSIGRGASAEVFKVFYQGELVALKKVRESYDVEALKREAVVINRLRHPNIIHLLGVCLERPRTGLLLELCAGGSLKRLCQTLVNSFVSVRILVDWAAQIASAMKCLASENLMHRDLKADNVLVKERVCLCNYAVTSPTTSAQPPQNGTEAEGYCQSCGGRSLDRLTMKITDFGNTKKIKDEDEKRQSLVGTYAWMAPEAYKCQKYSEASDVWSFGVVLWELLTRKDPHQGHLPITVAYLVSTSGFDLPIADDCPLKWKDIMQSCWNVEPENRPTFAQLLDLFNEYREELERTTFSEEQEALVQRVRADIKKEITEVYVKLNESGQDKMRRLCHKLYEQLDIRSGDSSSKSKEASAPEVRERRKGKKKIEKQDISQPQECRHLMSIQQPTSSKTDLKVIMFDRQSSNGLPKPASTNGFGTLPRRDKERLDVHRPLQPNLSISYPNLNEIEDSFGKKCGTLQRKDAIRKKSRPALPHDDIERFVPPVYDPDAENRPHFLPPGRVGQSGRRSEGTHEDSGKMKKWFSKFHVFRRGNHSVDSDEGPPSARLSPVSGNPLAPPQQPKASTGNYEHLSPRHRSSTVGTDDCTKLASPSRAGRNTPTDRTNKRHDIQHTQQTTRYVKPSMHQQSGSSGLNVGVSHDHAGRSPRREIGFDDIIPTTPEGSYGPPTIPVKHHHRRTPSDEKGVSRQNAFHNGHTPRSPHHAPSQPNLSTVVPPSTSSYEEPYTVLNARIPPPSTDPYIACPAPHVEVVNNAPYFTMTPKNSIGFSGDALVSSPPGATVQNDQYIQCPHKPDRPITLNLTNANTPESSGISTGGSSAFSNLSLADAVPTTHAPPPPRPPIIPPRDGSIGLPICE